MPPIIISSNDSLGGNVQDTDLLTLVRSGASILTQRYDQFAIQVRAGLATQGALSGHEGNQDAHYTPSQLVTALDNQLGSADWRMAGGGGGLAAVSHDGTLSGDGSVADPLGVPNPFSAAEKTKLAGIEDAATADQTGGEIVASITSNLGGSAWQSPGLTAVVSDATLTGGGTTANPLSIISPFSAAQASKLAGIETAATADQSALEIVNSINTELGGTTWQAGGGGGTADGIVQAVDLSLTADDVLHIRLDRTIGSDVVATVDLSSLAGGGTADGVINSLGATLDPGTDVLTIGAVRTIGVDIVATVDLSHLATGRGDTIFVQAGPPQDSIGQIGDYSFEAIGGRWLFKGLNTWHELYPNTFAQISGLVQVSQLPDLDAAQITSGIFPDARIPAEITRDTELAATTGDLGLAVDMTGNVYFRRDGTGSDTIHLSASGGGYAYVDRTLNNTQFDSALGEIRFGGADNSDRAGWYLAVQPQAGATRGAIPQDVSNEHWIRIDNDIYPNIGGGQTTRLTSLLFRHPTPADALSTIYTIDPVATDAEAVDDQGASSGNPYIYTPFQLASVVTAHQSPTHNLPHLAMLPTPNVGDLALLDHDYTQGNRRDAEVTFNTLGASFHGWSDGSVFGRSGTTNRNLSPLQFIRLQYNGSVYTASQLGSTNRSWIDRLDKYVSDNTEYDLGPTTTQGGHFVRAIVGGPNNANIATPVDINLKFTDGAYWLTDGTVIIWPRGEYLWNNDTDAYEHYDGWLGLTVRDHSANAFSGIKELRLHQSLKDFSIPGDPESLGLEISTAWLQPKIAERVKEYARLGSTSRVPLSDTYADSVVGGTFDETARLLTLPRADGGSFTIAIPAGGGGGGGGDDAFDWATVGNTDIIPGPKLPSDLENVDNSDITYTDATVSSFASRVAQLTTRTGVDSTQGDSYQFQWVDSDTTADKRIAIQVNGGVIRTVVFQDGAGLRRVNLGDLARYNIIQVYRGSGSFHFTGGTREAVGAGGNPDAFVGVSRANLVVTFTQADGTTETLTLPAGGGGGGLTEAEVDARVVAGTLAEARAGDIGRWGAAKMFGDTLVGVQVSGNVLTLTDARGGTAGRNLPNAVTGGALTLVGQQLSLTAYRHTGGAISLGSVSLPAGGGGGDDAYGWATVGDLSLMPGDKLPDNTVVGVSYSGGQLVFEYASGIFVPFTLGGGGGTTVVANPGGGGLTALTSITIGSADYAITGGGGGGLDLGNATELTVLDNADRVLVADQSDSWANKYMTAEVYAEILRPEVYHGLVRIASGPSSLNFDSDHFTVSGSNSGADIQLANVGVVDIDGLTVLAGNLADGDDLVVYDDSSSTNRKVPMSGIGAYTSNINRFITTTETPHDLDWWYFNSASGSGDMRRVSGADLKTYIGESGGGGVLADDSVTEPKLAMTNEPSGGTNFIWWNPDRQQMQWSDIGAAQLPFNVVTDISRPDYETILFVFANGLNWPIPVNTPAAGSVTEAMLAMHNTPANGQVVGWDLNNARMEWLSVATDQHVIDLINAYNPTAIPGAVTQTGGGDRGSGPRRAWEDHTHQIVGIQLDDIPGTPITTVPDDALLLVETSGGINRKITGANARTSLGGGGGSEQTEENTRTVEHILDRLTDFDDLTSDIDQTSVEDSLAFSTSQTMTIVISEPTDAHRTTGTYAASLTSFTIGPDETDYLLFRIGIDETPNLYEPQLYTSGGLLIQNLAPLGHATELTPDANYRYFWRNAVFPVEDTGTLRMRVATRTAHHTWRGSIDGRESFNGEIALTTNVVEVASVTKPASGQLTVRVHGHTDDRLGSVIADVGWIPTRATAPVGIINDATTNIAKFEAANRRIYAVWVGAEGSETLYLAAQAPQTYDLVIGHTE